eukprot:GEMP01003666.1.p1 GENE.GEMP01003666.1~~GEMP01003666.1.p1  ORF type:complete len:1127 (+),score=208.26 GEMP01003666.1:108-3488(+)
MSQNRTSELEKKFQLVVPLCDASFRGDIEAVDSYIAKGADVNQGIPHDERTPLHFAAMGGNLAVVKHLVNLGGILKPDRFGLLPVHEATSHTQIRQYLQDIAMSMPAFTTDELSEELGEQMRKVFQLVAREGYFPYNLIKEEVQYAYTKLGLHPKYFQHYGAAQISRHIHVLIAAKKVAQTTDSKSISFKLEDARSGFFLTTLDDQTKSREMTVQVADYLQSTPNILGYEGTQDCGYTCTFMASEGPIFPDGTRWWKSQGETTKECGVVGKLGIFICDRKQFDKVYPLEETDLELVASRHFLETRTKYAKESYQRLLEKVVEEQTAVIQIVDGVNYPGESSGFVLQFATAEIARRNYLIELNQCFRYCDVQPKRYYIETFANGVVTYVCYFPTGSRECVERLAHAVRYIAHFKQTPNRSSRVWDLVVQNVIKPSTSVYFLGLVKFCYSFFPKERYFPQYNELVNELKNFPNIRFKLDEMYRQSLFEVINTPRIYDTVIKHWCLCERMFDDFEMIARGQRTPFFNEEIWTDVQKNVEDKMERQVLHACLIFNEGLMCTNFFKQDSVPAALCYRFDPKIILRGRSETMYPEVPYGIFLVCGRGFYGFHVRFREISRGGIRLIRSRDRETYEKNANTLFEENYNLAYTQHLKNKDIPESGAKGTILLDTEFATYGAQSNSRNSFLKYIDSLLDIMMLEESKIFSHLPNTEILFFGPDENTADLMDIGALRGRARGYKFWKSLTTGKSTEFGGVPHDVYGITTNSVHQYVLCLLEKLGIKEEEITKFQTGGPDGDLGSNEILISKDKTIGIVDGSGVLYDPAGLDRQELTRLAKRRQTVNNFSESCLGPDGFLFTVDAKDIVLPDGSFWRNGVQLRDKFHFTHYAKADLFVPCGGRPASVTGANVTPLCNKLDLQWKYVVEGANLFFTNDARLQLESAGVHLFRDASANKGGVTSSSLEVLGSLCMSEKEHNELLTVKSGEEPSEFYKAYVVDILNIVKLNAKLEFEAIWRQWNMNTTEYKFEITRELSDRINRIHDTVLQQISKESPSNLRLMRTVLQKSMSPILLSKISIDAVMENVPKPYVQAMVCSWIASRFVYSKGGGEFEFYQFLSGLDHEGERDSMDPSLAKK